MLVAIAIPVFTTQLEKSRETVDVSNMRAAYALGQADALVEQPASAQTKYYNPANGSWSDAKVVCGKGTATSTTGTYDLPSVCTYTTDDDVTSKGIKVTYDKTGVTEVVFD